MQVTTTPGGRAVSWDDDTMRDNNFKSVITVTKRGGKYQATLHLAGKHKVPLHTTNSTEAKRRCGVLYDMVATAIQDVGTAASTAFMLSGVDE